MAKVAKGSFVLKLEEAPAYLTKIKGKMGSRPLAAFLEIDHYGLSGVGGRIRALVQEGGEDPLDYGGLGQNSSHKAWDLAKLPTGKLPLTVFSDKDFPDFANGRDVDVPFISFAYDVAMLPNTYVPAPAAAGAAAAPENILVGYRLGVLCYTRRPVL